MNEKKSSHKGDFFSFQLSPYRHTFVNFTNFNNQK